MRAGLQVFGTKVRVGEMPKSHLAKIEGQLTVRYSPTMIKDTLVPAENISRGTVNPHRKNSWADQGPPFLRAAQS